MPATVNCSKADIRTFSIAFRSFYASHFLLIRLLQLFFLFEVVESVQTVQGSPTTVNLPPNTSLVGGRASLPCNVSSHVADNDPVSLVLWYKGSDMTGAPLYSLDARFVDNIEEAVHFVGEPLKGRGHFELGTRPPVLVIEPIREEDAGEYFCRMDFRWSRTVSSPVTLNVVIAPHKLIITNENGLPYHTTAGPFNEGEDATLRCTAKGGKPPPALHWLRNGTLIDNSYHLVTDKDLVENDLVLKELRREDLHRTLTCVALTNFFAQHLQVNVTLEMNLKPLSVEITTIKRPLASGAKMVAVCQSVGSRPPAQLIWLLNSRVLPYSRESYADEGNLSTSFLDYSPSADDNGASLVCKADNHRLPNASLESGVWTLDVQHKPKVQLSLSSNPNGPSGSSAAGGISGLKRQKSHVAIEGSSVLMSCLVRANPKTRSSNVEGEEEESSVKWFFNQKEIVKSPTTKAPNLNDALEGRMFASDLKAIVGLNNGTTLELEEITRRHQGFYRCSAANSLGTGDSEPLRLEVHYKPICRPGQRTSYASGVGDTVAITCEVEAGPSKVAFEWTRGRSGGTDGQKDDEQFKAEQSQELSELTFATKGTMSTLVIIPKTKEDFATYSCRSRNSVGWQLEPCTFTLVPSGPPHPVHNCQVTNATSSSLSVSCDHVHVVSGSGSRRGELFYVLEVYDTRSEKLIATETSSGDAKFVVTSRLVANTTYLLVIYSENDKGRSGNVLVTAATLPPVSWTASLLPNQDNKTVAANLEGGSGRPDVAKECLLSSISDTKSTLNCQAGHDGGLEQRFILEVYEDMSPRPTLVDNQTSILPSFVLSDLRPEATYILNVFSANNRGRSEKSVQLSLTTRPVRHISPEERGADFEAEQEREMWTKVMAAALVVMFVVLLFGLISKFKARSRRRIERQRRKELSRASEDDRFFDSVAAQRESYESNLTTEYEEGSTNNDPDIIPSNRFPLKVMVNSSELDEDAAIALYSKGFKGLMTNGSNFSPFEAEEVVAVGGVWPGAMSMVQPNDSNSPRSPASVHFALRPQFMSHLTIDLVEYQANDSPQMSSHADNSVQDDMEYDSLAPYATRV